MINPITDIQLRELPLEALVSRMDDIIVESFRERHGVMPEVFPLSRVSDILVTKKALSLPKEQRRIMAHLAFAYLVQLELNSVSGGIGNREIYNEKFDPATSWNSPMLQMRWGVLRQFEIISSRIAFELFMDLLHFVETGERLEANRSKLKKFRIWLCDPKNQFHYFADVLLRAYHFDRNLRSPEIHGKPKLPRRLLLLQPPSSVELNEPNQLYCALLNCWRALLCDWWPQRGRKRMV